MGVFTVKETGTVYQSDGKSALPQGNRVIAIRRVSSIVLFLMTVSLMLGSFARNEIWFDDVRLWEDTVRKNPAKVRPVIEMGKAYHGVARDYDKALSYYQSALAMDPVYTENVYNNIAVLYFDRGQYDLAIRSFTVLLSIQADDYRTYFYRGNAYFKKGDYVRAIQDYNAALKLNRQNPTVFLHRGASYFNTSQFALAHIDYLQACRMGTEEGCLRLKDIPDSRR